MNAENILSALTDVREGFIADADAPARRGRPIIRRIAVLAAALVLCVALAATAAAYTDVGYAILYDFSPAIAQTLKPVNESCEANGVRMTVTDAGIDGGNAWFRIAMTDLEGDLFDGSIDLCESYDVKKASTPPSWAAAACWRTTTRTPAPPSFSPSWPPWTAPSSGPAR